MTTNRKSALIAGITLLFMAVAAIFTFGIIHNMLVVPGNQEATTANLTLNGGLFRTEVSGWYFILVCDVVVAWALYIFFKNENKKLSLLTATLRIIFVFIFGVALFHLINVLTILNGNITEVQMAGEQIMGSIESFETTWSFGLIIFGFHLLLLGVLALKSNRIHNFWGITLVVAAVSYIIVHSAKFLYPEFESQIAAAEMALSVPMAFGEIGFAFWLIMRGGKPKIIYKTISV
jgi:hypothetical protein